MPDIFDEVQEDLRAERARAFGRRFGALGVAAALVIMAATGGFVLWQNQHQVASEAVAAQFLGAAKVIDKAITAQGVTDAAAAKPAADALAAVAGAGPAGYEVLARLRLATSLWQLGRTSEAVAAWKAVTDDAAAPALLRDLATLASAEHQVDHGDPVLVKQQLESLTAPGNPWAPMALQMIALIDVRTGKTHEATAILRRLTIEPNVPQGIRQMAGDLLTTLPEDPTPSSPGVKMPVAAPTHG